MKKTNITSYVSRNIWSSTRLWNKFKTNFLCFVKPRSVAGCLWVKDSYRSLGGIKSELPGGSGSRPFWCSAALPSIPKVLLPSPSCGVWQIFTEHLIVWDELASDHEARSQYCKIRCIVDSADPCMRGNLLQTRERHMSGIVYCLRSELLSDVECGNRSLLLGRYLPRFHRRLLLFGQCLPHGRMFVPGTHHSAPQNSAIN